MCDVQEKSGHLWLNLVGRLLVNCKLRIVTTSSERTDHDEVTLLCAVLLERLRDAAGVQDALEPVDGLVVVPVHGVRHLRGEMERCGVR